MKKERKKREQKLSLRLFFFAREKMATARASHGHQAITARPAAQTALPPKTSRGKFVFCSLPTNFTVRRLYNYKNKCNLYVLARNFEPAGSTDYWILRTIEFTYYWEAERLDLNRLSTWTAIFCTYYRELRTTECTYYREMTVAFLVLCQLGLLQGALKEGHAEWGSTVLSRNTLDL